MIELPFDQVERGTVRLRESRKERNHCSMVYKLMRAIYISCFFFHLTGQFGESSNGTCAHCQSSCKHCDPVQPTKCISCPEGKFIHMHQCMSAKQCPTGTYANTTSGICDDCPVGCSSCSLTSGLKCLACSEGFVMHKSQCLMRCPEGTFPRHSNRSG